MANEKRLIDADEALLNTYNEIYWTESEAAAVRSFLVHQKSVDAVEVVHGRWERDEWGSFLRRCSVCKKYPVYKNERGIGVAVYAGFCFNCGARMDLEVSDGKG